MPTKAIRFGVWNGKDRRAATWKLWTQSGHSDAYLACRELGGVLKASLHQSGYWHIAYSQQGFKRHVEGAIPSQKNRFTDKWPRPKAIAEGVTLAFRIITPYTSVTSMIRQRDDDIVWIPNAPSPKATEIDITITSLAIHVSSWPGRNSMGTSFIGSFALDNGETVWVVSRTVKMPDLSSMNKGTGGFYKGRSRADLERGNLRALAFGHEPDGSRTIYDFAVSHKKGKL